MPIALRFLSWLMSAAVLFVAPCVADAAPCLSYSGTVTLKGKLSRHTFPEQPNYESIANGDTPATYFFVSPAVPFCVSKGADEEELAIARVERIQLLLENGGAAYDALRPYLGKSVTCVGHLFPQQTGHHHSAVLLEKLTCTPMH